MSINIMDMFDWSMNIPTSDTFVTEEDFRKSCTYRNITGTFRDPLLSDSDSNSDSDSEIARKPPPRKIISYSIKRQALNEQVTEIEQVDYNYVPGLFSLPYFSSLSSLDKKTHLACLKVLASKDTAITGVHLYRPNKSDLNIYEKSKETIAKEQKEYVECAKKLWLNNHCVRVLKHPPNVENVEKKDLEVQSAKIRQLPQNYEFYEVVNISSITNVDLVHRQNIYEVRNVPLVRLPTKRKVTLSLNRKPWSKQKDPTFSPFGDVSPIEVATPVLDVDVGDRSELLKFLSELASEQDVDVVAAASALCCLQDNSSSWLVPVTVLPAQHKAGKTKKRILLEGEIQIPSPMGTIKMERAYTQLFIEMLTCSIPEADTGQTSSHHSDSETNETSQVVSEHMDRNVRSEKETDLFDQLIVEPSISTKTSDLVEDKPETTQPSVSHNNINDDSDSDVDVLVIVEEEEEMENQYQNEQPSPSVNAPSVGSAEKQEYIRRPSLYEEDMTVNQQSPKTYVGPMTRCRTAANNATTPRKNTDESPIQSRMNRTPTLIKQESSIDDTIMKASPVKHACNRKYSTASIELKETCDSNSDSDSNNVTFDVTSVVCSGKILMDSSLTSAPLNYSSPYPKLTNLESREIKRNAEEVSSKQTDQQAGPWRFSCEKNMRYSMEKLADDLPELGTAPYKELLVLKEEKYTEPSPKRKATGEEPDQLRKVTRLNTTNTLEPIIWPEFNTKADRKNFPQKVESKNETSKVTNKQTEQIKDNVESVKIKAEQIQNAAGPKKVTNIQLDDRFKPIEPLSERRFDKWELCTPDGRDNISMIVHCSHRLRTDEGEPVLAVPILEYQADVGASRLRRVQSRALALYLRGPKAQLLTGRLIAGTSELLSLQWNTLDLLLSSETEAGSTASMACAFSLLHRVLTALQRLQPGNYILRHDAKQSFSHVYIYKERAAFDPKTVQDFSGQRINLHELGLLDESSTMEPPPAPSLCAALLPWHLHRRILPLVFLPHDFKQPSQHTKMREMEQKKINNTPKFIKKKKKKNKNKK